MVKINKKLLALDLIVAEVANGCYTSPISSNEPKYNLRELDKYAKKRGIDPSELTVQELKQFEVRPNLLIARS